METCWAGLFLGIISMSYGTLSRNKPNTQGTTYQNKRGNMAMKAVDGNPNTCCAQVADEETWWTVDLETVFAISRVLIYNQDDLALQYRLDQLSVEGFLGEPYLYSTHGKLCGYNAGPSGDEVDLNCPNSLLARYIRVKGLPNMTLCEVDVFGQAIDDCVVANWTMKKQAAKLLSPSIALGSFHSNPLSNIVHESHKSPQRLQLQHRGRVLCHSYRSAQA